MEKRRSQLHRTSDGLVCGAASHRRTNTSVLAFSAVTRAHKDAAWCFGDVLHLAAICDSMCQVRNSAFRIVVVTHAAWHIEGSGQVLLMLQHPDPDEDEI
jgi:hypothetical protein